MYGDLKLTFMRKCMIEFLDRSGRDMRAAGTRLKVYDTGEGLNSISGSVSSNGAGVTGSLSFQEHLRFADMGVGKGDPLGGLKAVSVALKSQNKVGDVLKKNVSRKPRKLYSKPVYSNITYLHNKLLYGFTEETIALLKQEIAQKNNANV